MSSDEVGMKRRNRGVTLIEILLAFSIFALVGTACLALFSSGMLLEDSNRAISLAASHAEYVLENLRNTDFDSIASDINSGVWNLDADEIAAAGMEALDDSESIVTTVSGTGPLDVLVTVSWQDRRGRDRSESFETLIYDI